MSTPCTVHGVARCTICLPSPRWCPRCGGSKSPTQDLCIGCGITMKNRQPLPCPCECSRGGFCGGCGHAGCGGRR